MTGDGLHASAGAISTAARALDAELDRAPVDEYFTLILRACARGGLVALRCFCSRVRDPANRLVEAPVRALVDALDGDRAGDDHAAAADGALRAAAWTMAAQRVAETWPRTFYEVLEIARLAMPLAQFSFERMQILASLSAGALRPGDADEREGMRAQFSRESLEHVIAGATGRRPTRRDMLIAIPPWTECFIRGIHACDEHLRELEVRHPALVPR